jgi:hypothetical protein
VDDTGSDLFRIHSYGLITPNSSETTRSFGLIYRFHLPGRRVIERLISRSQRQFVLFFDPVDGYEMFLRITRCYHSDDLTLHNLRHEDLIFDIVVVMSYVSQW